jgi:hypothetical protein
MPRISARKRQRVRVEFEYESKNFRTHKHPPTGCDLIICWRHNWPDCPGNLEVIELSRVVGKVPGQETPSLVLGDPR